MAHVFDDKKRITTRIRRIKGQLEAVERSLEEQQDCFAILQTLSACRGGMNGLMGELIEGHIRGHVMRSPNDPKSAQDRSAEALIKLLKTYWK
ncbi:MAG: metal/formaldehyde-sensitive transcriptional repressor [Bdellovibrionales bacterium]|jgi:DNA-binding FrmR family transcriptional regulator|nr:metal/formaldehyde-sensitive transcriptional repressor [Bdellovibrionales bacterium]MBT3526991.1 metal/formaldehyde-sensitive transcriptional repressor [Bdellovibrionales bacterium]MBT7765980.1 metal/formaldehyde-sensitive transcriptional repressor [Bdellovibrionales bacterium]